MESEAGKLFRSFQSLDGIGKQIFRIGMYFKLNEIGAEDIAGKLGGKHSLFGIAHAARVGQQLNMVAVEMGEHFVALVVFEINAFHGHCDHLRTRSYDRIEHELV